MSACQALIAATIQKGPSDALFSSGFHANLKGLLLQILNAHYEKWKEAEPAAAAPPAPTPVSLPDLPDITTDAEPEPSPKRAQPQTPPKKAEPKGEQPKHPARTTSQVFDDRPSSPARALPEAAPAPAPVSSARPTPSAPKRAQPKPVVASQPAKPKREARPVGLPKLLDVDWRLDIKSGSDSMARMAVPTVLVRLEVTFGFWPFPSYDSRFRLKAFRPG